MIRLAVWASLALFIAWVWRTSGTVRGPDWAALGVTLVKDKVYRTDGPWRLTLDLYLPATSPGNTRPVRTRPVLIAIHGGSWYGGSKVLYRNDDRNTVIRLAQQGIVVVAIDYRLARPGAPTWPAVLDDVREAVRWVRREAANLRVDPDRIVVMGQSSGAHLAALVATIPEEPNPATRLISRSGRRQLLRSDRPQPLNQLPPPRPRTSPHLPRPFRRRFHPAGKRRIPAQSRQQRRSPDAPAPRFRRPLGTSRTVAPHG